MYPVKPSCSWSHGGGLTLFYPDSFHGFQLLAVELFAMAPHNLTPLFNIVGSCGVLSCGQHSMFIDRLGGVHRGTVSGI